MKKKILVVGGAGFVGSRFINDYKEYFDFTILDKNQSPFFPEISKIADIRDYNSLEVHFKNIETVVLLAAEHKDDVSPVKLYYDVNVQGTKNVLRAMSASNVNNIIFTSSVAVYGLNKKNPDEQYPIDPFNHYGKSKWKAEQVLNNWLDENSMDRSLTIVRPTVIFGERNRGNVYNLLNQISKGNFIMIGRGNNKKSMAYVGNVTAFIKHKICNKNDGKHIFNYVDKPDLTMNELLSNVYKSLDFKKKLNIKLPYWIGVIGGFSFDILAKLTGEKYPISSVRIKKFCATTAYNGQKAQNDNHFAPPFSLQEGFHRTLQFEFVEKRKNDNIVFYSE
jgi:nucleoside-diphosphate-sugar epimerase